MSDLKELVDRWLADNTNPEKFRTYGKFDDLAPSMAMMQLFLFARDFWLH